MIQIENTTTIFMIPIRFCWGISVLIKPKPYPIWWITLKIKK